jgi:ElaB/YqjD/DUF883 family membrane-anchored ribosome-binding protein
MTNEDSNEEIRMALTKEQEELYRKTMAEAKAQYDSIDEEMEKEIQKTRETFAKLQESKKSFQQIYESTAKLLGIKVDLKTDDGVVDINSGDDETDEKKKQSPPEESEEMQGKAS